ncbi:CoxI protein [Sulfitobacter donghicola DSW-25 = KCTC 12864 = JCM 14565]|uniref:Xanthine dehydrogenase maturation protein XdhC n=1 Tax=Sulfitobacter donghicola DSW-25 = KCTC 12864 = JCM 14565 TaxID=1300350 RepID=A0A073IH11_9RHOB|nr:xanthine dehydrogenase maturation protein XdhC [Sulfitobacter donghicola DSW-25 = KCTC 12864 = JCM 14565]KIN67388.1 CoxI protein [Sulfitobacter donghicola DSW-25 = KCTC 12864 = JCM 14565]
MVNPITYHDHAVEVLAQVAAYVRTGQRFVLITSVDIKGGSARDLGSLAVVNDAGEMTGYMSNGCIDQDILLQALECLRSGSARLLRYGDGSPFRDLTLPCGGALSVWIDPAPDTAALVEAYNALLARAPATLTFFPETAGGALAPITIAYQPKVALTLAGRGAIFRATAKIAHAIGFDVTAFSPDLHDLDAITAYCNKPPTHVTSQQGITALELDATSGFLTLFHDHDWEPAFLVAALATTAGFIGALGSQRTHAARLAQLADRGISERDQQRIRGPIGLVPSLRNADLIAVSALAEIAQAFAYEQQLVVEVQQARQAEPSPFLAVVQKARSVC